SLRAASISFVLISVGGLVIGAAVSWLVTSVPRWIGKFSEDDDPAAGVVLTLLIPFAAYLIAERFGCSGILAAVSAGMVMNFQSLREGVPTASRMRMTSTWTMIEFVFNGMVFILLGLQFPHIIGRAFIEAHRDSPQQVGVLLSYVAAVVIALYGLRFGWVWVLRWVSSRGAAKHGVANAVPGLRTLAMTTIGGVRGAITLAGVLSLPVVLPSGEPLPGRDLAIFIASATILMSLLIGVIGLPLLLNGLKRRGDPHAAEELIARRLAAQAAIRAIDTLEEDLSAGLDASAAARCVDSTARVMNLYRRRLEGLGDEDEIRRAARQSEMLETKLRMAALRAERSELLKLRTRQAINDETLNKLMREIDLSETAIVTRKKGASV
ncbi:cation:proton antiporter, partial [Caballeronia sp.]|uniref:cation:proton antiporter domain-containing protein n=1 Tax=Caballeronia sp. TaxID=1931223 RepID=UPI003C5A18F4